MLIRALPVLVLLIGQAAPLPSAPAKVQTPPKTYNETADAKASIATAIKSAATDDIRVLINWGANDCDPCAAYLLTQRSREVGTTFFSDEYRQVFVDVGHLDKNMDVAKSFGVKLTADALPALTVLDRNGKVLANVSAADFKPAGTSSYSAPLIATFLKTHQAPPPNDTATFNAAVKQAKKDGKVVFVWFSAPW